MARIEEVRNADATPEQEALFERDRLNYGDVLKTTRVYAHRPQLLPPLQEVHSVLDRTSSIDRALVSLARLRVAQINACPF